MTPTPVLFGFLLGAALGVLITDLRRDELRAEAGKAFNCVRISQLWKERKGAAVSRILWLATHIGRLEWFVAGFIVWVVLLALWIFAANFRMLWLDPDWLRNLFIGSLVGAAAAPWVWLHFSRDLPVRQGRGDAEAGGGAGAAGGAKEEEAAPSYLDRYKFLTIALGIILLLAMVGPSLMDFLLRSNKVEALGISISLPDRSPSTQASVLAPNTTSTVGNRATEKLADNTGAARRVAYSTVTLEPMDLAALDNGRFEAMSAWDRDRGYIAYFVHAADHEARPSHAQQFEKLGDYVRAAEALEQVDAKFKKGIEQDEKFLTESAPLFACLDAYANEIGDIHLFFLDTSDFLENFTKELKLAEKNSNATETRQELKKSVNGLWENIKTFMKIDRFGDRECGADAPTMSTPPVGATPYPALLALYNLAAVDSPEAGVLYMSSWIRRANASLDGYPVPPQRLQWYLLRANINLAQMASKSLKALLEPERLVVFQRRVTDQMAALLGVPSPEAWRKLCKQLQVGGIHARIGRRLAMTYASERNYLFELQDPALIQAWRQAGRSDSSGHDLSSYLRDDLDEAITISTLSDCFKKVPIFEAARSQWSGQFQLNIAQLRIGLLPTLPPSEVVAEVKEIRRLLDVAENQLGHSSWGPTEQEPVADQLLFSDRFDDQRRRVRNLQLLVAKLASPQ